MSKIGGTAAWGPVDFGEFKCSLQLAARLDRTDQGSTTYHAYTGLLGTIASQLNNSKANFGEAPVLYTPDQDEAWPPNPNFADKSRKIIRHYQSLRQIHEEVGAIVDHYPPLESLRVAYDGNTDWSDAVETVEKDWARHWAIPYLREGQVSSPDFSAVLDMQVIAGIRAKDIKGLFKLTRQETENYKADSNCEWIPSSTFKDTESFQCRAYSIAGDSLALRVELRLVYKSSTSTPPIRMLYFLPIPLNEDRQKFIAEVQDALPVAKKLLNVYLNPEGTVPINQCTGKEIETGACVRIRDFSESQKYIYVVIYNH